MNKPDEMFWAACFYEGYLTNKDTNDLQELGLIRTFTDIKNPTVLSDAIHSDISQMLKTNLKTPSTEGMIS